MADDQTKPTMWATLDQYERKPDAVERESWAEWNSKPQGFADALESLPEPELNLRRRSFLKMSGFATVLATLAACQKPVENILPYVNAPEEITPGVAVHYASTCGACGAGCGLMVKNREGRPIKLEGNPASPVNKGTLCIKGQASLIELYDPDRVRDPINVSNGARQEWDAADGMIAEALRAAGSRAVLLTGTIHGPARTAVIKAFQKKFPGLRHVQYEALSDDDYMDAQAACYGERVRPRHHFEKSDVTVLLGADPMADSPSILEAQAGIGQSRKLRKEGGKWTMGRLYSFEPLITMSGMNADLRYRVKPQDLPALAAGIAAQLLQEGHSEVTGVSLGSANPTAIESKLGLPKGTIKQVADDLWAARGRSIVYAGGVISRTAHSKQLHTLVNLLNSMLGNEGKTVDATRPSNQLQGSASEMLKLVGELNAGAVDVLLVYGSNPVYSLPDGNAVAAAIKKARLRISFGTHKDETASLCNYILPGLHYLESWGDAEPFAGALSLMQPTIGKLWNNRAFEDSLLSIAYADGAKELEYKARPKPSIPTPTPTPAPTPGPDGTVPAAAPTAAATPMPTPAPPRVMTFQEFLAETWRTEIFEKGLYAGSFEDFWHAALRAGVLEVPEWSRKESAARSFNPASVSDVSDAVDVKSPELSLALYTLPNMGDGRHANNPWLLEIPDAVSKICWDNFVAVSPVTARANKLEDGDIIKLTANGRSAEAPVRVYPGAHDGVLSVAVGWGRTAAGAVGDGEGFNAYALASSDGGNLVFSGHNVTWEKTGKTTRLADVMGHNYLKVNPENDKEPVRPILQQTSLDYFNESELAPQAVHHIPYWEHGEKKPDIWWGKHKYLKHKWTMAIDLNACIGCNACMVACQAENNIPVVGKREVLIGREMHWLRMDRYYKGDVDNPEIAKSPMLCQQCDNAPCETVCPVLATAHSDEGINQQIYNRCVGTRYCANNCPYKIRRFNWYQYSEFRAGPHENMRVKDTPLALALNPDITVRTRGIMEKCTFCQQRLRDAKMEAKAKGRNIPDGAVKTACQQTCPAQAIHFGDALNPEHSVNKLRADNLDKRGFGVLEEFNVLPNVMYLASIRNRPSVEWDVAYHKLQHHSAGHGEGGHEAGGHETGGHEAKEAHGAEPAHAEPAHSEGGH